MLTLYYAPGTCALASHIALETAGADYRALRLNFKEQQQRSTEYLRINPKGRVPALVTERGILTETPAILQFVAQTHPERESRAAGRSVRAGARSTRSTATCARPCTSRMRTACAATAGPTTRPPSRR